MNTDALIGGIIGVIAGALFIYILTQAQLNHLKNALVKADEEIDALIHENNALRKHNGKLYDRLKIVEGEVNIPDFSQDW